MTLYDRRKGKLISDLKDKEYRDAFVEEQIYTGIPFQIKALRKQRGRDWTQKELGQRANMFQTRINVLESPDYERLSLKTLLRLASAFDIGLMVRFVPISDLVNWELNLSPESLEVPSYADDPYFKEQTQDILNEARMALEAPEQPKPSVYLIYDATRKKEPSIDELYASKQKGVMVMMGVGK